MKALESAFEKLLLSGRWLLTPIYLGLLLCIPLLVAKLALKFYGVLNTFMELSAGALVAEILSMVDLVLIANLRVIVVFASYEGFVSRLDDNDEEGLRWMGKITYSDIKLKVVGSISAIAAIELLRVFFQLHAYTDTQLRWKVIILASFVVASALLSASEWLNRARSDKHN